MSLTISAPQGAKEKLEAFLKKNLGVMYPGQETEQQTSAKPAIKQIE